MDMAGCDKSCGRKSSRGKDTDGEKDTFFFFLDQVVREMTLKQTPGGREGIESSKNLGKYTPNGGNSRSKGLAGVTG